VNCFAELSHGTKMTVWARLCHDSNDIILYTENYEHIVSDRHLNKISMKFLLSFHVSNDADRCCKYQTLELIYKM
jgi:hypothetical protein